MRYLSTRGGAPAVGFDEVLLHGLAPDGGLYLPAEIPPLEPPPVHAGYPEVVTAVCAPFVEGSRLAGRLADLVADAYTGFRHHQVAPLTPVEDRHHLLELYWGPTLSFKDYALQLVGRLFDALLSDLGSRMVVLGATSGDTGSAAIAAVAGREAITAVILFPSGRVSEVQRRQMTTVTAANVQAVAVEGTFDDCQRMVKAAFADAELRRRLRLGAVNSINWARVMAQTAYYVWAWMRLGYPDRFQAAIPTGNFGNTYAAYLAREMGVPISPLIVATNANRGLAELVGGGRLRAEEVQATLAPAMDIQIPSNLERYLYHLAGGDALRVRHLMESYADSGSLVVDELAHRRMQQVFRAGWADDARIEQTIANVHAGYGLVIDPHTAAAWAVGEVERAMEVPLVTVATAHPAKFPEAVEAATGERPQLPPDLADLWTREERFVTIEPDSRSLRELLLSLEG